MRLFLGWFCGKVNDGFEDRVREQVERGDCILYLIHLILNGINRRR